jgi:tripartite-type tricarboxylate transporter receptor subunit TctC
VAQRSAALPEVPTMDEAGLPGFRSVVWWAVLVPRGTPGEIIARLNADFGRIMKLPEVQERYASLGVFTEHSTPQQVTERMKSDLQEFATILKAAGVEAE